MSWTQGAEACEILVEQTGLAGRFRLSQSSSVVFLAFQRSVLEAVRGGGDGNTIRFVWYMQFPEATFFFFLRLLKFRVIAALASDTLSK